MQQEISKQRKQRLVVAWGLLSFLYLFLFCIALSHASPPSAKYPKDKLLIKTRNGSLYIKVVSVPLDEILKEISVRAKVEIHVQGNLDREITFKARQIPLHEALVKLIEGVADYVFIYSQSSILKEVWIFAKDKDIKPQKAQEIYGSQRLSDPRERIIEDIGDVDSTEIQISTSIEELLKSTEPTRRMMVIEMLGRSRNDQAVEGLISALNDEDEDVRESAAYALGNIGDKVAVEALVKALTWDQDSWVRASAAEALAHIGDRSVLPALKDALEGETNEVTRKGIEGAIQNLMHR